MHSKVVLNNQMIEKAMKESDCDSGIILNSVKLKEIITEFIDDDRKYHKEGLSSDLLDKAMETECDSGILINRSTLFYVVLEFVKNDRTNRGDDDEG